MNENGFGTLYLVATPVGNLSDLSFRAVQVLGEVDLIAAEDTRHTLKLLNHYQIKKPLISYYEHNKMKRGEELADRLKKGENIALVTDAGTPGISDPGEDLVKQAVDNHIPITMIPGPVASIIGLVLSGLSCERFCFEGFLPHQAGERKKRLKALCHDERTLVFYITPHRVHRVLSDLLEILGNRKIALCRELTKIHEEIIRGTIEEVMDTISSRESVRGEMVLVVEGSTESLLEQEEPFWFSMGIPEHMNYYIRTGMDQKEAMKQVARDRNTTKRDIYSACINEKKKGR